jgi:hypothetical protein
MNVQVFNNMLNQVMLSVTADDDMVFKSVDGKIFRFTHFQDCCENVSIEDIAGNLQDLVGYPLLMAEEVSSLDNFTESESSGDGAEQWTYYRFATVKGSVTVRWYGTSNGYYSTGVSYLEE